MKNEPKIRMKGFEGEWKEYSFNNLFSLVSDYKSNIGNKCDYKDEGKYPIIDQSKDFIVGYTNKENPIAPDNGIIVFGDHTREIKYIDFPFFTGADGTKLLHCQQNIFPLFGYYTCCSKRIPNTGYNRHYKYLKEAEYIAPELHEQHAIATYFHHLDTLIETADKKLASLKQVKEASLQTMFPQEGQSVPKVRFKGFEGEWNICTGDDLFETYNERNRPDLPVLSAFQDIRGMAVRSDSGYEISHDKRNEVTYKVVKPGQFVMHLRSFQGGFAHSAIEGITSPAYTVFGFKEPNAHNDYYWKTIFMSSTFIDRLKTITYGIRDGRSISFPEFLQMKFRVPCISEQRAIASFFLHLDKQIELAQQRLALLRRIKSACLDEMFV